MKYIFDFDDVIFHTTRHRKEHMFTLLEKAGIPFEQIEAYYRKERENQFSLKKLLAHFSIEENLYEEIMKESVNFTNLELLEMIKKIGKDSCYVITYGDKEYNWDKIMRTGAGDLFHKENIFIVSGSKKEIIEQICEKHYDEKIIFIDDKAFHFQGLDFKKCPNLKTILFTSTAQLCDALRDLFLHK